LRKPTTCRSTKNDSRQATHLWAMRFTININLQPDADFRNKRNEPRKSSTFEADSPNMSGLEVNPPKGSVKQAPLHRRRPVHGVGCQKGDLFA